MAEAQQGGNFSYQLGLREDADTIISDVRKMRRGKRSAVEFAMNPDAELIQSEAIKDSLFRSKSQQGTFGGSGNLVTEIPVRRGAVDLLQGALSADPETNSTDIVNTTVATGTDNVTPKNDVTRMDGTTTINRTKLKAVASSPGSGEIQVTQPTTPGILEITLDDATGEVTIVGKRKTGLGSLDKALLRETLDLDDDTHKAKTQKAFSEIDEIIFDNTGLTVDTPTDLTIVAEPDQRKTVFQMRKSIFEGWDIQSFAGTEPRVGYGMVPTGLQFQIDANARITIPMLGIGVIPKRTIEGGAFMEKLEDDSDLANEAFIDSAFYTAKGGVLFLDSEDSDDCVLFDSFNLNLDPGLQYKEGKKGTTYRTGVERSEAGANLQATLVVNFESTTDPDDEYIDWYERFRDSVLTKIILYAYFWAPDGKEYYHKITLSNVELTAIPPTNIQARGTLKLNLVVEAVAEAGDPEIEWEIVDDDGWFGVTPTMSFDTALATANGNGNVTIDFGRDVSGLTTDDITVTGATKGALGGTGKTRTLALTNSLAGTLTVTLAKNAVDEGNAETTETLMVS